FLTAALLLALMPVRRLCLKTADIAGTKAVRIIKGAAVILPILAIFGNPFIYYPGENRFGVLAAPPYYDGWHDTFDRYRPPIHVKSRGYGFRDADFSDGNEEGTRRAVIIGDSFVYGTGIPDEEMMIDRLLEKSLKQKSGSEWEVLNFGFYGLGLRSYWKVAGKVLDALRTDLIIICTLGLYDFDFFSAQTIYDDFGNAAYRIFSALGVVDDLHSATIRYRMGREFSASETALFSDGLESLIQKTGEKGIPLVIWEYYEPFRFFDRYRQSKNIYFTTWDKPFDAKGWFDDPKYTIPFDRHPTGAANEIMAYTLSERILQIIK
ncbi:MAG: SGNH/GDSL hydrolase family protein, partial [Deltaproteobacteria bacterium]|nr:SGNH/GDSL hydrolase family protein [Deltaproteobacteria bacterium]